MTKSKSRKPAARRSAGMTRRVVQRFVAGETTDDCLRVVRALLASNLMATVDFLGEDTVTVAQADRVTDTYVELLNRLASSDPSDVP